MKKELVFLICFFCVSGSTFDKQVISNIQLSSLKNIKVSETSRADLIEKFGNPTKIEIRDTEEHLLYNSSEGSHRLTLIVLKNTGVLDAILWIPRGGEPEADLEQMLSKYGKEKFKFIKVESNISHSWMPSYRYMNEELKMTAYTDSNPHHVRAIVWNSKFARNPASQPIGDKMPFEKF